MRLKGERSGWRLVKMVAELHTTHALSAASRAAHSLRARGCAGQSSRCNSSSSSTRAVVVTCLHVHADQFHKKSKYVSMQVGEWHQNGFEAGIQGCGIICQLCGVAVSSSTKNKHHKQRRQLDTLPYCCVVGQCQKKSFATPPHNTATDSNASTTPTPTTTPRDKQTNKQADTSKHPPPSPTTRNTHAIHTPRNCTATATTAAAVWPWCLWRQAAALGGRTRPAAGT